MDARSLSSNMAPEGHSSIQSPHPVHISEFTQGIHSTSLKNFCLSLFGVFRLRQQGSGGADGGAGTTVVAGEIGRIVATQKGDHGIEAPLGKGQQVVAISSSANLNALAAKHAAVWVVGEKGEVDCLLDLPCKQLQRLRIQADLKVFCGAD